MPRGLYSFFMYSVNKVNLSASEIAVAISMNRMCFLFIVTSEESAVLLLTYTPCKFCL